MSPAVDYEVRVAGVVGPAAREAFSGLEIHVERASTVLRGTLDQAALHGLIERIEALGLELIDLRRLPAPAGEDVPSQDHPAVHRADRA